MHLDYAKAYMKERLDEAHTRRLVVEARGVESSGARAPRPPALLGYVRRRLDPGDALPGETHSLEPACCVA
jgi:hypothetical protein